MFSSYFIKISSYFLACIALLIVLIVLFNLVTPYQIRGGTGTSMDNEVGAVYVVSTNWETIEHKDIIVFERLCDDITVRHRVLEVEDGSYLTKGDGNHVYDTGACYQEPVDLHDDNYIIGKQIVEIASY